MRQWPSKEQLGLDESQYKALQIALTREVAVIQGPPGTGETYLGLKVCSICYCRHTSEAELVNIICSSDTKLKFMLNLNVVQSLVLIY